MKSHTQLSRFSLSIVFMVILWDQVCVPSKQNITQLIVSIWPVAEQLSDENVAAID